ncbi:phosphate signaling complex protein PhoU [Azotosporobacter soli]|uniref:phosphate signaling complex protein PhoU n=1 Tax=Azotosporobacter soli TaxID=3055040 RepID=UPI0031FF069E
MNVSGVRQHYQNDLEALRQEILDMGNRVEKAIGGAVKALSTQDEGLARQIMAGDDAIDEMEKDIEDKCMMLIARQQPLAMDLRIVATGLKIATDLERVGDHAFDIAKITLEVIGQPLIKPLVDIPRMADSARKMVKDSLRAYIELDTQLAAEVCAADDEVDAIYQQVFRELLTYMMQDHKNIQQAAQLLFVARYLERVADHATNIGEWVIYLATGQRMRKQ